MKSCELCKEAASMYCESDQAVLCWDCDAKVHSANFLVAKHSRTLLCHVCQSPTPWTGSGPKLGPAVSTCERCIGGCDGMKPSGGREEESVADEHEENGSEVEYEVEEDDEDEISTDDEDGDNQVVPWSETPPPPAASSSSIEESSGRLCNGNGADSLKRPWDNDADLGSDDDVDYASSDRNYSSAATRSAGGDGAGHVGSLRPMKTRRLEPNPPARIHQGQAGS